jgi:hypothetical protein
MALFETYHTGIRVPDLESAMAELGTNLGVNWTTVVRAPGQPLWTPEEGQQELALDFVYSTDGDHKLELLAGPPGSFWDGRDQPGAHHVGVWSDDVPGDTVALLAKGWAIRASRRSPDEGFGSYTYVQPPSGTIVELVSVDVRPRFEAWWAGGSL